MHGYIYKITNNVNDKLYVGQTNQTLEARFKKHMYDALIFGLDTKFARAVRKYHKEGEEVFKIQVIEYFENISKEDLTDREYFWIKELDAVANGYNCTYSKNRSGGNTYFGRTEAQMLETRKKLSNSKLGANNPNASGIKCKNIVSGEVLHFGSAQDACRFFGEKNHATFTKRAASLIKWLYADTYLVAYEDAEFDDSLVSRKKYSFAISIKAINIETGESFIFDSFSDAERTLALPKGKAAASFRKDPTKSYHGYLFYRNDGEQI
jgi:group I intron endonuclease